MPVENLQNGSVTENTAKFFKGLEKSKNKIVSIVDNSITKLTAADLLGASGIGSYKFSDCDALTGVEIPSGVQVIGDYAFDNCYNLTSVTMQEGILIIGSYAFRECSALTELIIPRSVNELGEGVFSGCNKLHVTFLSFPPLTIGSISDMFAGVLAIYVPASAVDTYKTAWPDVANIISAIPE